MNRKRILKLTRLSVLLAMGVILNYIETFFIPTAFIAPGIKLGLANGVGLIVLYYFGDVEFLSIGFLRVLLSGLFTGFGFAFFIGLSGFVVSALLVIIAKHLWLFSIFGLSMIAAVFHGFGQIVMVTYLYQSIYMLNYLPILMLSGIIAGLFIAWITKEVLERLRLQTFMSQDISR